MTESTIPYEVLIQEVDKLEKENEQLKSENRLLKGRIEEYIEQLKGDVE